MQSYYRVQTNGAYEITQLTNHFQIYTYTTRKFSLKLQVTCQIHILSLGSILTASIIQIFTDLFILVLRRSLQKTTSCNMVNYSRYAVRQLLDRIRHHQPRNEINRLQSLLQLDLCPQITSVVNRHCCDSTTILYYLIRQVY